MISKLLGHKSPATTARYADLADDPAKRAAEQVGFALCKAMNGNDEGAKKLSSRRSGAGKRERTARKRPTEPALTRAMRADRNGNEDT